MKPRTKTPEILARQRLMELNAGTSLDDLGRLSSVGLHKLKGNLRGYWSLDINGPWRILFRFARNRHQESFRRGEFATQCRLVGRAW